MTEENKPIELENNNLDAIEIDDDDLEGVSGGAGVGVALNFGMAKLLGKVKGYYPGAECPNPACDHQILKPYSDSGSGGETICPNCGQTWSWSYTEGKPLVIG